MIDIYELTWTDGYSDYAVCPECDGRMELMVDDDGRQEWHCDACWYAFSETGRRLHRIHKGGMGELTCPVCGDFRVDHDLDNGGYYCRNCKAVFRKPKTEAFRDKDGWPSGRLIDLGPIEYPEPCPICGDPLRAEFYELLGLEKGRWAFYCRQCDVVYPRNPNGTLRPNRECPKCFAPALCTANEFHTDYSVRPPKLVTEKIRECQICGTKFDLDCQYLDPADAPTEGNRPIPKFSIGTVTAPKIGGE